MSQTTDCPGSKNQEFVSSPFTMQRAWNEHPADMGYFATGRDVQNRQRAFGPAAGDVCELTQSWADGPASAKFLNRLFGSLISYFWTEEVSFRSGV